MLMLMVLIWLLLVQLPVLLLQMIPLLSARLLKLQRMCTPLVMVHVVICGSLVFRV